MARMKTFFIYFLLVVAFFLFSQVMIYIGIHTTYQSKKVEIKTTLPMQVEVKATSVNGFVKGKITNSEETAIENQYIKIECYSKHNVLMGTKYIKIDKIDSKEEKEFEVPFRFNKVDRAVIQLVAEKEQTEEEQRDEEKQETLSAQEKGLATMLGALIVLWFL